MDDRRVRRPPGSLRDNLFSVLVAVSVVVATGTVPASAAPAAPVRVSQAVVAQGPDGPAAVTGLQEVHDAPPDVETVDTPLPAQGAVAAVLAEVARLAEAAQLAQTVTQAQQALLTLGYQHVGQVDGIAGRRTAAAIEDFQADAGHPVTGAVTAEALTQLLEKVDAGWRRPAPAQPVRPAAQPDAASPADAAASSTLATPAPVWTTYVANTGNQATIDLCAGGLTSFRGDDGNPYFAVPYLTIHNNCGGAPILKLTTGDVVAITGGGVDGSYQVVDSRDVSQGSTTAAVAGLAGDIYLQTCYVNSTTMRIVGAVKVS